MDYILKAYFKLQKQHRLHRQLCCRPRSSKSEVFNEFTRAVRLRDDDPIQVRRRNSKVAQKRYRWPGLWSSGS
ncbi:Hypothetical predicted protein [Lecanosticta acicola]|uniref:Uncharacterized protein n=1 Tax=Lecanosticta acicola TaxID=111012 RepID=A0AAI8YX42_9PEZI|nr:Hypothetical predicted protein [Lecanosticta acicola]